MSDIATCEECDLPYNYVRNGFNCPNCPNGDRKESEVVDSADDARVAVRVVEAVTKERLSFLARLDRMAADHTATADSWKAEGDDDAEWMNRHKSIAYSTLAFELRSEWKVTK